jgi:hypothetical protein
VDKSLQDKLEKNLKGASPSTIDTLARRLWRLPAERAVVAIDLGVGLGSVSLRAALECLKAAPEVATRLEADDLRVWGDIGRRLAATSPEASVEFFAASAAILERLPAERRPILLQLVTRQAALSPSTRFASRPRWSSASPTRASPPSCSPSASSSRATR